MPIDNVLWRARVGHVSAFKYQTQGNSEMRYPLSFLKIILFLIYFIFSRLIRCISFSTFHYIYSTFRSITNHLEAGNVEMLYLLYCGCIEIIPGPKQSSLTFCHWNMNGIAAHDFTKISLLQGYITDRYFDIMFA